MTSPQGMFDFLRSRGEEFLTQISNELLGNPRFLKAMQAAMRGKEWVDEAVAQALRTMNVPTRTEFKRAVARIDTLERELAEARREAAAAKAAGHPVSAPRARSRTKKTAARKTAGAKRKARGRTRARSAGAKSTPATE